MERSLAGAVKPVLQAANPTTESVNAGLQKGAGFIMSAGHIVGSALNQAANGGAAVVGNAVAGADETVRLVPGAVHSTLHAIDKSEGALGNVGKAL